MGFLPSILRGSGSSVAQFSIAGTDRCLSTKFRKGAESHKITCNRQVLKYKFRKAAPWSPLCSLSARLCPGPEAWGIVLIHRTTSVKTFRSSRLANKKVRPNWWFTTLGCCSPPAKSLTFWGLWKPNLISTRKVKSKDPTQ